MNINQFKIINVVKKKGMQIKNGKYPFTQNIGLIFSTTALNKKSGKIRE